MHSFRDSAIDLARSGFRVFPLAPGGKIPAHGADWKRIATADPEKVHALWTDDTFGEQPFNIGIALDAHTLVIDVDVRDGKRGAETLRLLEAIDEPLPATYRVRTASKGDHHYFRVDPGAGPFGKSLGTNVDIKTAGGYVVGPGSIIDGKRYAVVGDTRPDQMQPLPVHFVGLARAGRRERDREKAAPGATLVELDSAGAITQAVNWLRESAPDHGTFAVAAKVKDFGVSEERCVELMLEHWRDRLELPKDDDHVALRVRNAYRYGRDPAGVVAPEAEFGAVEVVDRRTRSAPETQGKRPLAPGVIRPEDVGFIPPRQWLYGKKLSRKYTGFVASPGGVGKTAWVTTLALACASGRQLLHDKPHHPMRVWMYNLEDDIDELRRRVAAAMRFHDIPESALDNLRLNSGRDRGLKVIKMQNDSLIVQPDADALADCMRREDVELLIVDPFLRSHGVPENSNEAQDEVMRVYASIAQKTNAAILLVHHTKKGASGGDQEGMRGGGTQGGGARSVMMLAPMQAEEANKLGISERKRRLYVRVDDGKNNMAPPVESAEWFHLAGMSLDNGTPEYPEGDSVQVAHPWTPPSATAGLDPSDVDACLVEIIDGMADGERYSARPQDKTRWAGTLLMDRLGRSPQQAAEIVRAWLQAGALEIREYESKTQRKARKGLFTPTQIGEKPA